MLSEHRVGDVTAVELTRDSATTAILRSSDRFPDYRLCLDRHGIEIDLRQLPGEPEADHRYYSAAKAAIDEVIDHKLVEGVARENIAHLSVFAFARIPLLVYLGSRLDDTIPTEIYQRHRAGETWDWPPTAKASDFLVQSPTSLAGASEAVLVLNVSGTIQPQELPANLLDLPTFVLQPDGELPQSGSAYGVPRLVPVSSEDTEAGISGAVQSQVRLRRCPTV